ncbi:hypothetical protein BVX94_01250 [bacterium B17]|nr:hypothetical protein BVX94_01250 [bacterium B17]
MKQIIITVLIGLFNTVSGVYGAAKPNIILIMADDFGYETIAANGAEEYKTPVLDKMAAEGMRFTQCFAQPLCTPSRVKIMTGMYNIRNYKKFGLLPKKEKTFAHMLKTAGYATCIVGKWQLGGGPQGPEHFGFDQSLVWHNGRGNKRSDGEHKGKDNRYTNPQLELNGKNADYTNGEFSTDVLVDFANDFMEKNTRSATSTSSGQAGSGQVSKPFLVYYPMILTHCPFVPTPGTTGYDAKSMGSPTYKGDAKYFGDMVNYVDKSIGRLIAKLEELNIRDNTLIIFTGDNGTDAPVKTKWNGRTVKAGKGRMTDNGVRVPLIVSWPKGKQSGVVSDELVDFSDMLPTMCEAAGIKPFEDVTIDGVSLWGAFNGKKDREKPYAYIWYNPQGGKNGNIMARTQTRLLERKAPGAPYKFHDCSEMYGWKDIDQKSMSDDDSSTFTMLKDEVEKLDKIRKKNDPAGDD